MCLRWCLVRVEGAAPSSRVNHPMCTPSSIKLVKVGGDYQIDACALLQIHARDPRSRVGAGGGGRGEVEGGGGGVGGGKAVFAIENS